MLIAGSGLGIFQRSDRQKTGSLRTFPTAALPTEKAVFYMSKLIDIFDILFQTRVKYVGAKSSPLVCRAHPSLRA